MWVQWVRLYLPSVLDWPILGITSQSQLHFPPYLILKGEGPDLIMVDEEADTDSPFQAVKQIYSQQYSC
jgi:hypothetical protein